MKQLCEPKCPYCGDKLNYAETWVMKRHGEYICPKCGGISDIVLSYGIYRFGFVTVIIAAAFFIAGLIFGDSLTFITLPGIFIVFLIFFLLSPLMVRLRKTNFNRPQSSQKTQRFQKLHGFQNSQDFQRPQGFQNTQSFQRPQESENPQDYQYQGPQHYPSSQRGRHVR